MKAIQELLEGLLALFLGWVECIRRPIATADEALALPTEQERIKAAFRIWLITFLISFVLQWPLLRIHGIAESNVAFHAPYALMSMLTLLAVGAVMLAALRLFGIGADFPGVLAAYSCITVSYSPLVTLLMLPGSWVSAADIHAARDAASGFGDFLGGFAARVRSHAGMPPLAVAGVSLGNIFIFVTLVVFGRYIAVRYKADRAQVFSAIGFSIAVLLPLPMAGLTLLYAFLHYAAR